MLIKHMLFIVIDPFDTFLIIEIKWIRINSIGSSDCLNNSNSTVELLSASKSFDVFGLLTTDKQMV